MEKEKQIKRKIKLNDSKEKSDTNCDSQLHFVCTHESSSELKNKHARHKISSYKQIIDVISIRYSLQQNLKNWINIMILAETSSPLQNNLVKTC